MGKAGAGSSPGFVGRVLVHRACDPTSYRDRTDCTVRTLSRLAPPCERLQPLSMRRLASTITNAKAMSAYRSDRYNAGERRQP